MNISDELIAAYLDGRTNKEETLQVLNAIKNNAELRELLDVVMDVETEMEQTPQFELQENKEARIISLQQDIIPMMQLAAKDDENICSVICEAYILKCHNIEFDTNELIDTARQNGWLKADGTPLHAIGQLLAHKNLLITRKYNTTIEDLIKVLSINNNVIVAVNEQKLSDNTTVVVKADHAVVVTGIDPINGNVSIYDPQHKAIVEITMDDFINAWNDSHNYMVRVLNSIEEYEPEPINIDDIDLSDDLIELREAIAENLHEVWAITRMKEGWTYGPVRDDAKKQHPDIIPYCALPDSEREYDRLMAWNTLKLVKKLGFSVKKE